MGIGMMRVGEVLKSSVAAKLRPAEFVRSADELPRLHCEVGVSRSQWEGFWEFFADVDPARVDPADFSEIDDDELATRPVPPALLHALCFPSMLDLLTDSKLGIQPLGVVVTDVRWTLVRPVHPREPLELTARVSQVSRDEAGTGLTVECTLRRDGRICYREETRYRDKGRSGAARLVAADTEPEPDAGWLPAVPNHRETFGVNAAGRLEIGQAVALTTLRAVPSTARGWAEFSGDSNPIHLSAVAARLFGYKKVVLHGAAIDAWTAHTAGITGEHPCAGAVSFRAPALLPSELELIDMGGERFVVVEKKSGRDLAHVTFSGAKETGDGGPDAGSIVLPRQDGRASSTVVTQGMCAGAAAGLPRVRNMIEEAKPWRKQYRYAMEELSRVDAPARGARCARDGLDALRSLLHFADGRELAEAEIQHASSGGGVITGSGFGAAADSSFAIEGHTGDALIAFLREWEQQRIIQPAATAALLDIVRTPELLNLEGVTFVCLGAGAELSPAPQLLEWGADVAAVMRPGTERAAKLQRAAAASAGRLFVAPDDACDIVREPERIAGWAAELPGRLVVVDTLYAPGADFLLAAAGANVVERLLSEARPDTMLAWIGSPTDAYVLDAVPVKEELADNRWAKVAAGYAKAARVRAARIGGVYSGFVDVQGPNYAAAKRIGRWCATVERAAGRQVSYNVGPMSLTRSVLDSAVLRAAYGGMAKIGMPALAPDTSASIMAALLVWDIEHPEAAASDTFLTDKAVDCGLFASPFEPNGLMGVAVALGAKDGLVG